MSPKEPVQYKFLDKRLPDRFWDKVEAVSETGCWRWTAGLRNGYGHYWAGVDRTRYAHRVSYEAFACEISKGLVLDHLCRNRKCVNPSHLEVVTHKVNILRGEGACAKHARKALCSQGHSYDKVYKTGKQKGMRYCGTCKNKRQRARRLRNRMGV